MTHLSIKTILCLFLAIGACLVSSMVIAGEQQEANSTEVRNIPGITGDDIFQMGCVSCHVEMPHQDHDARISTIMKRLTEQVEPLLLEKAQATAPEGVTLEGIHPATDSANGNIPSSCLECHGRFSKDKRAPRFAQLMHLVHLSGGTGNHFITMFHGECTHCHKLDMDTGTWTFSSGMEK